MCIARGAPLPRGSPIESSAPSLPFVFCFCAPCLLQVQKRLRAVAAIRGLPAYALYLEAVGEGLCFPAFEPDPEDLQNFSKRAWEGAVQSWRRGVEAGPLRGVRATKRSGQSPPLNPDDSNPKRACFGLAVWR